MNSSNIHKRSYNQQQEEDELIKQIIIDDLWTEWKKGPNDPLTYNETMGFIFNILGQMGVKEL